ncbi:MAG: flavodoxin family protein [Candidatus Portnoybacteria bacterium]|nr:flavodoxin family protein [Candidatus Portnoybacteria bacterium]MDD4982449.1 flavodoxin family protein [Candidatus Portnoybacteria bacterium]
MNAWKVFLFNLLRRLIGTETVEVRLKPREKFQGPIKILGISGSPRGAKSSSHKMLETLLAHARSFGAETKVIMLCEKKMKPCEGCVSDSDRECEFPCIHCDDDTNEILQAMIDADAFVFATPVHWSSPSAAIKILIDKMTAIEENRYEITFKNGKEPLFGNPCVLLASQEGDGANMALGWMAGQLRAMGVWALPWGQVFKPNLLNRKLVRIGLRVINQRKFEWVDNTMRADGRNLVLISRMLKESGYQWDDFKYLEPNC